MQNYDLIVIGAGPGGYEAAIRAARYGLNVALAEMDEVGGTCLNRGCIPTKTLMHAAHLYHEMTACEELGVYAKEVSFDIEKIYARKDDVVSKLRTGIEFLLKANKVSLIKGKAVITSVNTVSIMTSEGNVVVKASNILIASGSVPACPPIEGLNLPGVMTSSEMLEQAGTAYKKLTIIGGGVIGVEFASIFAGLGCEVTIIEAMDRLLPTMDKEISQNLNMIFKKRGIKVFAAASVERIAQEGQGLMCHFTWKGKTQSVEAEAILAATGRRANIEGLFSEGVNVKCERGIVVDEHFQTSIPGIYAIGDVIHGGIQLAHAASAQGLNAVAHIAGKLPEIDVATVPSCIYTNPEIASVGLSADEAKSRGIEVKTGKFLMSGNGKSMIEMQDRGFIKVVFDAESEVILGAGLMCARATDLISELAAAIVNKLTLSQLNSVIRPHPTFSEGITEAVEAAHGMAIHIAPPKQL